MNTGPRSVISALQFANSFSFFTEVEIRRARSTHSPLQPFCPFVRPICSASSASASLSVIGIELLQCRVCHSWILISLMLCPSGSLFVSYGYDALHLPDHRLLFCCSTFVHYHNGDPLLNFLPVVSAHSNLRLLSSFPVL